MIRKYIIFWGYLLRLQIAYKKTHQRNIKKTDLTVNLDMLDNADVIPPTPKPLSASRAHIRRLFWATLFDIHSFHTILV